jgi:predicted acetyltransferase
MRTSLPIRSISEDEFDAFARVIDHAFGGEPDDEETREVERRVFEFDRTLAAFDGDRPVASAMAYSFSMTVPGGDAVPTAGVTWVSVLPTHRRQGLLTQIMRRQLGDIHAAQREPVAALWASEASIYGRFGYGLASTSLRFTVPRAYNQLRPVFGTEDLRIRLVEPEESLDPAQAIYEHDVARRPGMLTLPTEDWRRARIHLPPSSRAGGSPLRAVLVEDADGVVRAYARYTSRLAWEPTGPDGTTAVRELHALDPAAAARAWQYLLDLDLAARTTVMNRPSDEPLLHLLVDPRRSEPSWGDALYVRLVDVAAALAARTYTRPVDLVIEVSDPVCLWNAGRWRLSADETGARCESTGDPADVRVDVRELGGTYLGSTSLVALAGAGLVEECTPGATARLSSALRSEPAPWCPIVF